MLGPNCEEIRLCTRQVEAQLSVVVEAAGGLPMPKNPVDSEVYYAKILLHWWHGDVPLGSPPVTRVRPLASSVLWGDTLKSPVSLSKVLLSFYVSMASVLY